LAKAQAIPTELVYILAVLFIIGIVFIGIKGCTKDLPEKTSFEACKASNAFRVSNMAKLGATPSGKCGTINVPLGPLACTTWDKKLEGDRDKIEKEFAALIAKCWEEFLEGQYHTMFADYENYHDRCFICYTVNIEDIKDESSIDMDELRIKLKTLNYDLGSGNNINVLDYVQKHGFIGYPENLKLTEKKPTYAIAFASESFLTQTDTDCISSATVNYIRSTYTYVAQRPRNSILIDELGKLSEHCVIEKEASGI